MKFPSPFQYLHLPKISPAGDPVTPYMIRVPSLYNMYAMNPKSFQDNAKRLPKFKQNEKIYWYYIIIPTITLKAFVHDPNLLV